MKKFFVTSDIHGFYYEFIRDLTNAGFDINNQNHVLIVLGDIFDRGKQPLEIYKFLRELPKERRILVRGNHELLLKQLVDRGFAENHDFHNKTVDTLFQLCGYDDFDSFTVERYKEQSLRNIRYGTAAYEQLREKWNKKSRDVYHSAIVKDILDWIASDEWCNYYETKDYIFVHSFIPVRQYIDFTKSELLGKIVYSQEPTYREDWRNATQYEWEDAVWGCPWKQAKDGLNQTGKIIVCGHWHTSDFYNNLTKIKKKYTAENNPIFKSDKYKIIGIDACTALSREVNVFIFEE